MKKEEAINIKGQNINCVKNADDIITLNNNNEVLQKIIKKLNDVMEENRIEVNMTKRKAIRIKTEKMMFIIYEAYG